ncbi:MAG: type 1 glutamine amidotransferase domain-containing protein [Pseudobdellovibrionaceae bacterium]
MAENLNSAPKNILIPLPSYGFDPTESSIPWHKLIEKGHHVVFATPDGKPAAADKRMVSGVDLPLVLKKSLMAQPEAVKFYLAMSTSPEFLKPIRYDQIDPSQFDALLLPGGHDKGMRVYLESVLLQNAVANFFENQKPVGAICHGTLLAARSKSKTTGHSVLWGKKTTGLTHNQEMTAYNLTRLWLDDYYRTYPTPMADELISYLKNPNDYSAGPGSPIPVSRDSDDDLSSAYTVRDGKYLSARWPGDAHLFGNQFVQMIEEK